MVIVKELRQDEISVKDKYSGAGIKAESQMAFYLKRKFSDADDVFVFNSLRFVKQDEDDEDAAQIDHLVMHRHGFILIESKSVTSKVRINARQEWSRLWNNHWQGMGSPIEQAKRQVDFLRSMLNDHHESLRNNIKFLKKIQCFNMCPFEILVSISDQGIIEGDIPSEVRKADQIPDKIEAVIKRHKRGNSLFGMNLSMKDGMEKFADDEIARISQFLLSRHIPITIKSPLKESKTKSTGCAEEKAVASDGIVVFGNPSPVFCTKCNSNKVNIQYGSFGYFYRCLECNETSSIENQCSSCGQKAKIRKKGNDFFRDCRTCSKTQYFFCNQPCT